MDKTNYLLLIMRLTRKDLKILVTECVKRILLEHHHSLGNSLEKLAELIIDVFKQGGGKIPAEEVNSVNPYFKIRRPLYVTLVSGVNFVASYSKTTNEIEINTDQLTALSGSLKETLMHELSHFIDSNLRTKPFSNTQVFLPTGLLTVNQNSIKSY